MSISKALEICLMRVEGDNKNIHRTGLMETTIKLAFPGEDDDLLIEGLKRGSYGEFGGYYKFTAIIACIWIREHIKTLGYRPCKQMRETQKLMEERNNTFKLENKI